MALRLQMKLGVVAEHDRLARLAGHDRRRRAAASASVARSKGHLYLLVTSRVSRARPARRPGSSPTRSGASTTTTSRPGSGSASQGDPGRQQAARPPARRLGLQAPAPTARSASASPSSGATSCTSHRRAGRGLPHPPGAPVDPARPAPRPRPAVARARARRLARRDLRRRPARPRLPERRRPARRRRAQGRDGHAPPAVGDGAPPRTVPGRRRRRQRRRDRVRGDRVAPTPAAAALVPVRPAEPLAGTPDRSPIPLADSVSGGAAAAGRAGRRAARPAARSTGSSARLQDLLPRRRPAYRRVTPLGARRETQRRAAVGAPRARRGRRRPRRWPSSCSAAQGRHGQAISSVNAGQAALERARANLTGSSGPGIDLVTTTASGRTTC